MSDPGTTPETPQTPAPTRPKRFSMIRSFTPADLLTLGNATCGMASILLCLNHVAEDLKMVYLWAALGLLPVALVLDAFDGWVARKTRRASSLGADLDSLADIVSFGVAPAVLAFTLGMRGLWDALVLVYFVVCGISRLARYNVTAADFADESGKVSHFEGTPIPTSLSLVIVLAVAFGTGAVHGELWGGEVVPGPGRLHPLVLMYAVSGSLMISTIRIPKP